MTVILLFISLCFLALTILLYPLCIHYNKFPSGVNLCSDFIFYWLYFFREYFPSMPWELEVGWQCTQRRSPRPPSGRGSPGETWSHWVSTRRLWSPHGAETWGQGSWEASVEAHVVPVGLPDSAKENTGRRWDLHNWRTTRRVSGIQAQWGLLCFVCSPIHEPWKRENCGDRLFSLPLCRCIICVY